MRLVVETDGTRVIAVESLEPLLEHGSLAVRLDRVQELLTAVRTAASAVVPADASIREADPVRMEAMAQTIVAVAGSAKALADRVGKDSPDDIDVAVVLKALGQLGLVP